MKIRPFFAWHDMWVGVFIDREKRRVYILPIPCLGIRIDLATSKPAEEWMRCQYCGGTGYDHAEKTLALCLCPECKGNGGYLK